MEYATASTKPNALLNAKTRLRSAAFVLRYTFPNLLQPRIGLSDTGSRWLETLRRDGIVRIEEERFRRLADYVEETYFAQLQQGSPLSDGTGRPLFVKDINKAAYKDGGTEISSIISFKDPVLATLFFDSDLHVVLYNYYHRQPYFRNQPVLQKIHYDGQRPHLSNGNWHVDNLHQVSIMFLISDVTERDTHMQYAIGSHTRVWPVGTYPESLVAQRGWSVFEATGLKGTFFLFDAGGIHRANYVGGTTRKILHLNFTTGHNISADRHDHLDAWPELSTYPKYSRRMMEKVGL